MAAEDGAGAHEPRIPTVLGPHAFLRELKVRGVQAGGRSLSFDESYRPTNRAFRPMVEQQRFGICELALATYVQARSVGRPISLIPVTVTGQIQHGTLVHDSSRGSLHPKDLEGGRVGIRSYTQTTGLWVRAILDHQFGVDLAQIEWVVADDSHVRGLTHPPNVTLVEGADIDGMFLVGELDALIDGGVTGPTIVPVIEDPIANAERWHEMVACPTINHGVTVREELLSTSPGAIRGIYDQLRQAVANREPPLKGNPGTPGLPGVDLLPVGWTNIAPALRYIADECFRQGLIGEPLGDEALVHPLVREWD